MASVKKFKEGGIMSGSREQIQIKKLQYFNFKILKGKHLKLYLQGRILIHIFIYVSEDPDPYQNKMDPKP